MRHRRHRLLAYGLPAIGLVLVAVVLASLERRFDLPIWVEATGVVSIGVLVSQLGLSLVVRLYTADLDDNDAVSAAFGTVAGIYALLFGFLVVVTWQDRADADAAIGQEANALAELEQIALGFDFTTTFQVRSATDAYTRLVVDEEWPQMADSDHAVDTAAGDDALARLWSIYTDMGADERTSPLYAQSISRLHELSGSRTVRIAAADSRLAPLLWFLLYVGAGLTVLLACLFRVTGGRVQRILIGAMTAMIALALLLVSVLDNPFDHRLPLTSEAFEGAVTH